MFEIMKRIFYTLIVVCCLGGGAFGATNEDNHTVAVNYAISSLGSDIGTVSSKTVGTARDYCFHADVKVNVRFWFLSFSFVSSENANIRGGKLVNYHKIMNANGHCKEITGELNGSIFKMVVREDGKEEYKDIPVAGYVTTNLEYPEMTLAPREVQKMRVVDLENTEIVDREYRHDVEELAEINGRGRRVMVTNFFDKNAEGRRWTAIIAGLPIILRQEGKEKTGLFNPSYKVLQTSVVIDP